MLTLPSKAGDVVAARHGGPETRRNGSDCANLMASRRSATVQHQPHGIHPSTQVYARLAASFPKLPSDIAPWRPTLEKSTTSCISRIRLHCGACHVLSIRDSACTSAHGATPQQHIPHLDALKDSFFSFTTPPSTLHLVGASRAAARESPSGFASR